MSAHVAPRGAEHGSRGAEHGSAVRATAAPAGLLSIGQVLARLNPEYPELSNSKLRFLEDQGLVTPSRTKSGYRKFTAEDVERLRVILSLQRDHYLPLKVIRGYLDDIDSGAVPAIPAVGGSLTGGARRFTREELLAETGAGAALFVDAVSNGLILPGENYGDDAVQILRALLALADQGIEPRHLRGIRGQVQRDLSLIERAVAPIAGRRDVGSRAHAAQTAGELLAQLDTVRAAMTRGALARITP